MDPITEPIVAILASVALAVFWSLLAYGKSYLKDPESFEPKRLIRTVVQSVIIGGILWTMGLSVTPATILQAEAYLTTGYLVVIVDIVVIMILRYTGWGSEEEEGAGT